MADIFTRGGSVSITGRTYDDFKLLLLSEIRDHCSAQRSEISRQTAIFARIDERLKRNGMSLAKRNRK